MSILGTSVGLGFTAGHARRLSIVVLAPADVGAVYKGAFFQFCIYRMHQDTFLGDGAVYKPT